MTPLEHFAALARDGGRERCSSGELRARKIAEALIQHVGGLDAKAVDGLWVFAQLAHTSHREALALLSGKEPS